MNWNSTEFIWLDWLVLTVGVIAIVWAVYRAIKKDQEKMKGADSQDYLLSVIKQQNGQDYHYA